MTKVLITGAGGFIGSHLVDDQLARGRDVVAVDVHEGNLANRTKSDRLRFVKCDVTDTSALETLLPGIDVVFHLASLPFAPDVPESRFYAVNVRAVTDFLAAARTSGVKRFVHCSSGGIHGDVKDGVADEEGPFHPANLYEKSKLAGEREALRFFHDVGFPVSVLRPSWVFGPRCPRTEKLLKAIRRGWFINVGDGRSRRHPVYVADVIQAFNLAAEKPEAVGEAFVIAGPSPVTVDELVGAFSEAVGRPPPRARIPLVTGRLLGLAFEAVSGLLGVRPPLSRQTLRFFTVDNAFSIAKATRVLGYTPAFDLRRGLQETVKGKASA